MMFECGGPERDAEQHKSQVRHQLRNIRAENVGQELADIFEHRPALLDRRDNTGEIVIKQNQVRRTFGDIGAGNPHRNTDVSRFKGRRVVDSITRHRNDFTL